MGLCRLRSSPVRDTIRIAPAFPKSAAGYRHLRAWGTTLPRARIHHDKLAAMTETLNPPSLSLPQFVARWKDATLSERSAAQQHFLDLCRVLGQPSPAEADQTGTFYTFEKGVQKTSGGSGFADVWLRGHFAWEYKG